MKKIVFILMSFQLLHCNIKTESEPCESKLIATVYEKLENEMQPCLHAPWRENIFDKNILKEHTQCPFCTELNANADADFFVLYRSRYNAVTLNPFPYSKGHILIIPFDHKWHLKDLSQEVRADMMELATISLQILEQVYGFKDANVGFNIGKIAGASVVDHIHLHIIPRSIQPSFIQIIGQTNVASWDMKEVYKTLKKAFDAKL